MIVDFEEKLKFNKGKNFLWSKETDIINLEIK